MINEIGEKINEHYDEFISEFVKLNLEIVKEMRSSNNYDPELLKELRENAQALRSLV